MLEGAAEFALGFASGAGATLARRLERDGFSPQQMEASGLVLKREEGGGYFDRFRNRLIFPIWNESGKLVAFAGRALEAEQQPKYLNSPETEVYHKGRHLYGFHLASDSVRRLDRIVVVEGYMDVIACVRAGAVNTVSASPGQGW